MCYPPFHLRFTQNLTSLPVLILLSFDSKNKRKNAHIVLPLRIMFFTRGLRIYTFCDMIQAGNEVNIMKKIVLCLLVVTLVLLPVLSSAEDYTIIREIKMLETASIISHLGKSTGSKIPNRIYYETAKECFNQKVTFKESFYATAVVSCAFDILHQIPDWNIQLTSNIVEDTAYFGYTDKDGSNELLFIFYQGSGNYAIADYVVGERTLVLFNQAFSKETISAVLDQLFTKYTTVSQEEIVSSAKMLDMVYADIY